MTSQMWSFARTLHFPDKGVEHRERDREGNVEFLDSRGL